MFHRGATSRTPTDGRTLTSTLCPNVRDGTPRQPSCCRDPVRGYRIQRMTGVAILDPGGGGTRPRTPEARGKGA